MSRRELLRVDAKVVVEYQSMEQFFKEYATNISCGGLFIRTKDPLKPQTVIDIVLRVPELNEGIDVVGEVVHVIDSNTAEINGWDPGMGVHFIDYDETAKDKIEAYVTTYKNQRQEEAISDRRREKRINLRLRVKFPSAKVLKEDFSESISKGGIFIQTSKPRNIGDQFTITLRDPDTEQELALKGEVVRVTKKDPNVPGSVSGMGIRFIELTEKHRYQISKFLSEELPAIR